jgi:peptidoglycan/xylan/chitin deacetylase (PgdA/CDA1 family)
MDHNARMRVISALHHVRHWVARRTPRLLHAAFGTRSGEAIGILMYHRVAECEPGVPMPTWTVTPGRMRAQLAALLSAGYSAWPLSKVLAFGQESRPIPSNVFVITFDDGYQNNYSMAWPILKELGMPATIFLATAYLDTKHPFPFDDWQLAGSSAVPPCSWLPLSTEECVEMLDDGLIEFGSHTHTHQSFLGRVEAFRQDLRASFTILSQRFGIVHPSFAFPFGHTSPELIAAALEEDVSCALTVRAERARLERNWPCFGRFCVEDDDTAATIAAKLAGWYEPVDRALHALARPLHAMGGAAKQRAVPRVMANAPRPSGADCALR